jgi:hypothetical protein
MNSQLLDYAMIFIDKKRIVLSCGPEIDELSEVKIKAADSFICSLSGVLDIVNEGICLCGVKM